MVLSKNPNNLNNPNSVVLERGGAHFEKGTRKGISCCKAASCYASLPSLFFLGLIPVFKTSKDVLETSLEKSF